MTKEFEMLINRERLSSIWLLLSMLLFWGCSKSIPEHTDNLEEWPEGQNVYTAGFENVQDYPEARVWKNGKMENLAGNIVVRSTGNIFKSEARSVFVSGNDVYVAGYDEFLENGEQMIRARLWKNGEIQPLTSGIYADEAFSVFVSDGDVYVLGREWLAPSNGGPWALKYWKNGESIIFAQGGSNLSCNSIFVSDGNVYITGNRLSMSGTVFQAILWKNGVEENLIGKTTDTRAFSIFVSGNDVYVAGCVKNDNQRTVASLWKNGIVQELPNGNNNDNAYARSVFVLGSDVYVAGDDGGYAKLWKNGIMQDIPVDEDESMFLSVFVSNNDVYTSGYVRVCEPVQGTELMLCHFQATLWRNGKKSNLDTVGKNNNSRAVTVFVN